MSIETKTEMEIAFVAVCRYLHKKLIEDIETIIDVKDFIKWYKKSLKILFDKETNEYEKVEKYIEKIVEPEYVCDFIHEMYFYMKLNNVFDVNENIGVECSVGFITFLKWVERMYRQQIIKCVKRKMDKYYENKITLK